MDSLRLRAATPYDIDQIMALEEQGFDAGNRELRAVYEARVETFAPGALMAHLGENCVGCFFCEIWRSSPFPGVEYFTLGHDISERHEPLAGTELYVSSMTIAPAFRGQGLGAQLLRGGIGHVTSRFPQLSSAVLLVNETWARARAIYTEVGFCEIVRFERFFEPHAGVCEDGIVMRRFLPGAWSLPEGQSARR